MFNSNGEFNGYFVVGGTASSSDNLASTDIAASMGLTVRDAIRLDYEITEGLVDLFFKETNLKKLFPTYRIQSIGKINKDLFQKILVFR